MRKIKDDKTSIFIGGGVSQCAGDVLQYVDAFLNDRNFIVVADSNSSMQTLPLIKKYSRLINNAKIIEINATEDFKNIESVIFLWNKFEELQIDRNTLIVCVGGGVLTDMLGFAASTYKRGIKFINIPTTLLSMVDASVGGKTGIDFNNSKNEVGVFSRPEAVFICPAFIHTLPHEQILSGMAEVIKMYAIKDKKFNVDRFYNKIDNIISGNNSGNSSDSNGSNNNGNNGGGASAAQKSNALSSMIIFCVMQKAKIVRKDFKETGLRKTLNFGHTIGHALEAFLLAKGTPATHGYAVMWGMVYELFLSVSLLKFPLVEAEKFYAFAQKNYPALPSLISKDDIPAIMKYMRGDKKNSNGNIKPVLLRRYGSPVWNITVNETEIVKVLTDLQPVPVVTPARF